MSSRTSTVPGLNPSAPAAPRHRHPLARRRRPAAHAGGRVAVALQCGARPARKCAWPSRSDWRWGRTTTPMGCRVAARRSTRTVRSLAATGSIVTTAQRAATSGGSEAGSPQKSRCRASSGSAAASARRSTSSGSSVTRTVSDHAHDPTTARAARQSAGAASPRTGSTSPGSSGTSQVPSASSPTGSTTGSVGEGGSTALEGVVADVPRGAVLHALEVLRRLVRVRVGEIEGDAGRRDADRPDRGPDADRRRDRPSRQLAASKERSAGTPAKRWSKVAASSAPSDSAGSRTGSPLNCAPEPAPAPGAPAKRGAGHRAEAEGDQFGQVSRGSGDALGDATSARPAVAMPRLAAASAGSRRRQPVPELIRVHEARAATDVATEIERGERRPIRPVAQEIVRDAPERVARLHRVGRADVRRTSGRRIAARDVSPSIGRSGASEPTGALAPAPAASERGAPSS